MSDVERLACPACAAPCDSHARQCGYCKNHLLALRCSDCTTLHFSGARQCTQCGKMLRQTRLGKELEASCPRCSKPLSEVELDGAKVDECLQCGGLFVEHDTLRHLVSNKEKLSTFDLPISLDLPVVEHDAGYVKCPTCQTLMTPRNYGRASGVIVDVCGKHGTWFDAGELTRALDWVAKGGAQKTLERDRADLKEQEKRLRQRMQKEAQQLARSSPRVEPQTGGGNAVFFVMLEILVETVLDWLD